MDTSGSTVARLIGPEATAGFGEELARDLAPGVIALVGGLGAGKTHLVKGIAAGLGSAADVASPTFSLVHEYFGGRLPLYHFDFYRLESEGEVLGIGWDDYLAEGDAVLAVEWADRFPALIPGGSRWYELREIGGGAGREIRLLPGPPAG